MFFISSYFVNLFFFAHRLADTAFHVVETRSSNSKRLTSQAGWYTPSIITYRIALHLPHKHAHTHTNVLPPVRRHSYYLYWCSSLCTNLYSLTCSPSPLTCSSHDRQWRPSRNERLHLFSECCPRHLLRLCRQRGCSMQGEVYGWTVLYKLDFLGNNEVRNRKKTIPSRPLMTQCLFPTVCYLFSHSVNVCWCMLCGMCHHCVVVHTRSLKMPPVDLG